ncbi:MAG: ribonuclease HI [Novosphingobium sp. 16-62-11]|uniref:reverse transcriptase-like protein n=1 Tax=Novosphingobium sp. 17-62-19 TaxID=1970406 RepID=UPI000BCF795B|nr:reverse transcriptase-like protein [Novosphingobium sp. 17-62-19]OYX92679.1 MAG: ribonuclease HI [Novosphingobium sp. 35-62-5]OYZ36131.1 MAG: ribonuclease HI [Novosphingobium sp. 16-62-11]OZA20986.1 MAG: ribonuclease HI [Novosphingobium sp. 17-62-19]HQS95484.1 reverse transcriptase-like protein [Novosphingobium sp.]
MLRRLKVYFDGGCRPNPGRIEVAAVLRGVAHVRDDLGEGTNGDAEWLALIHALECAQASGAVAFDLIGDSRSVIEQANGHIKPRSDSDRAHLAQFQALAAGYAPQRIRWIKREQNLAGIALNARHPR